VKIEKDDFEAWRDSPITQAVFAAFDKLGESAKAKWLAMSWGEGNPDPLQLADLRARAEVVEDFRKVTLADLEEWLNEDGSKG
jgi:uncharacterized phage-associated protein